MADLGYTRADDGQDKALDLRGKSSATKPTDVPNGTTFLEMDTGNVFAFDAEEKTWYQM